MILHVGEKDGVHHATMDSPDQGVTGIPAGTVRYEHSTLELEFPTIRANYRGTLKEGEFKGVFAQNGIPITLNMKRKEEKLGRPQEPKPPFPYREEEV